MRRERVRGRSRPARVRVLLVGESPPASGRHFRAADSGLYRAVRDAFTAVVPTADGRTFLQCFDDLGWHLTDLCGQPVNHLAPAERRTACERGVARLARSLRRWRPDAVVVVIRSIGPHVRRAVRRAGWSGIYLELPYPGRWVRHRRAFARRFGAFVAMWFGGARPPGTAGSAWPCTSVAPPPDDPGDAEADDRCVPESAERMR